MLRAALEVRPYTVRKGDTLASIAEKRGLDLKSLQKLNHEERNLENNLAEGQKILLPAGKLSARDKDIIAGIGPRTYRTFPVRKGEKLADIMAPRGLTRQEVEALNPGVNLDRLRPNMLLKLPARKYTLREREVLIGNRIVPAEFFQQGKTFGIGIIVSLAVASFVAAWQHRYAKENGWLINSTDLSDSDADEPLD